MNNASIAHIFHLLFGAFADESTRIAPDERALPVEGGSTPIAPDDFTRRLVLFRSNINA